MLFGGVVKSFVTINSSTVLCLLLNFKIVLDLFADRGHKAWCVTVIQNWVKIPWASPACNSSEKNLRFVTGLE